MSKEEIFLDEQISKNEQAVRFYTGFVGLIFLFCITFGTVLSFRFDIKTGMGILFGGTSLSSVISSIVPIKEILERKDRIGDLKAIKSVVTQQSSLDEGQQQAIKERFEQLLDRAFARV